MAGEEPGEVLGGGAGVADVELHGGADSHLVADDDGARVAVGAEHAADEEVAPVERGLVLVDDDPDVQALAGQRPVLGAERLDQLQQALEGGPAGQLVDGVALGPGDD